MSHANDATLQEPVPTSASSSPPPQEAASANPSASPSLRGGGGGGDSGDMPRLIQAGMGVRVSNVRLANAVARLGAIGVVSSVGLRYLTVEEIRQGKQEIIDVARAFPIPSYVDDLLAFAPGGPKNGAPNPMDNPNPAKSELPKRLSVIAAFIEVTRAKQGHHGMIGINVMWKCALTALPSIYGAMLAGVDVLLCGAGVPMELPDIVRRIQAGQDLEYTPLHGTETNARLTIAPDNAAEFVNRFPTPKLIPILSNYAFPKRIFDIWAREYGTRPDAFVLENHPAGGHNAPPRNKVSFGEADDVDSYFDKVRNLGVPVYVAGAGSSREDFQEWIGRGAYGMQVGSRFALCAESGMRDDLKREIIGRNAAGEGEVLTSNRLSSTGYPFKYVPLPGTLSDEAVYESRKRICNKGYLMHSHFTEGADGETHETYVCPGMPESQYAKLGGAPEDTEGRMCLCNALLGTIGMADPGEPAIVTLGEDGVNVKQWHTARDIVEDLLTPKYAADAESRLAA